MCHHVTGSRSVCSSYWLIDRQMAPPILWCSYTCSRLAATLGLPLFFSVTSVMLKISSLALESFLLMEKKGGLSVIKSVPKHLLWHYVVSSHPNSAGMQRTGNKEFSYGTIIIITHQDQITPKNTLSDLLDSIIYVDIFPFTSPFTSTQ